MPAKMAEPIAETEEVPETTNIQLGSKQKVETDTSEISESQNTDVEPSEDD